MTDPVPWESACFVAAHIAPRISPEETRSLAERIAVPPGPPIVIERLDALRPTISQAEVDEMDTDMYVRHFEFAGDDGEPYRVRVSVENTLLKYQLYDVTTDRPVQIPMELLCRRLCAIGYRRYENQFSKLAIRTREPLRGTISLHKSGKLLVTGTANVTVARYLARVYIPQRLLPELGLTQLEARHEVLSNIVVKMAPPYTFSPFLMAQQEEEVTYEPTRFSSAMLKNAGMNSLGGTYWHAQSLNVADTLARRFAEPALPRRKWAISFFKPNCALFVGLKKMEDIAPMTRVANAIAYRYRYDSPANRAQEDALAAAHARKRTRKRPASDAEAGLEPATKKRKRSG